MELELKDWQAVGAVAGFLLFWIWESSLPLFAQRRRVRHAARNLAVAIANGVLLALVFAGFTVAIANETAARGWGLLNTVELPAVARIVFAILLFDLWAYWWHRASHRIPFLWRFHRMHHSDNQMDVTTATRFHPGEILISAVIRLLLVPVLGLPVQAILLYDLSLVLSTQFHHSNIGLPGALDRVLRSTVVSPNMHKLHHSVERFETDSNYASILAVWDHLFGTYSARPKYQGVLFGLPGWAGDSPQSLRGMLVTPLRSDPPADAGASGGH